MRYLRNFVTAWILVLLVSLGCSVAAQQQNLIGTVTGIDAAASRVTVKTDAGTSVTFLTGEKTVLKRVPPGQTSLATAETISFAEIKAGDRLLVPGGVADAQTAVKQVIVMAGEAIAARRDQERNDWQTRGISGRIASIEGAKNEITVQLRGRGGQETVVVRQGPNVKILRYAPDSLRSTDARPSSFAELRVGDQIRVLGNRSSDGTVVTADEIISGSVTRTFGTITSINVAANEVTIKNEQDNRTTIVAFGKNSVVKRLPPEVAQNLAERREQRQQRRRTRSESTGVQTETPAGRRTRSGAAGTGRRGGGFQQLLEAQPAVSLGELKVGDALLVTGSQGSDASHVTAINAITGDPAAMQLMQRPAGRRQRDMSTGLPGGTAGGNASNDDEP